MNFNLMPACPDIRCVWKTFRLEIQNQNRPENALFARCTLPKAVRLPCLSKLEQISFRNKKNIKNQGFTLPKVEGLPTLGSFREIFV